MNNQDKLTHSPDHNNHPVPTNPPGHHEPSGETYRFMVMKKLFETHEKFVTGRQICEIAGLLPPEKYKLDMKLKSGEYQEIGLDTVYDLSNPGLEKFVYITRDQTEG